MNFNFKKKIKYTLVFLPVLMASQTRAAVELKNPLDIKAKGGAEAVSEILGTIISNLFISIAGALALLMIVIGGYVWLTAAGNPEKIKKGRDVIIWTIVGLVIWFSAYTILSFIFGALPISPPNK